MTSRLFSFLSLPMTAALLLAGFGAESIHRMQAAETNSSLPAQIGGQDVVHLKRKSTHDGKRPEFLSAVILPGHGMNVYQITANIPGKGEVSLLAAPTPQDAMRPQEGPGSQDLAFAGAFLTPYVNRVRGHLSADGKTLTTQWNGHTLTLPANWSGKKPNAERHALHGLIFNRKTDAVSTTAIHDGEEVTGLMHTGNFGGHWLSETDLSFRLSLTGDAFDLQVTAKNVGHEQEPISIAWHPYFAIPSGNRAQARLHLPASERTDVNSYDDVFPTGKMLPVRNTQYDFEAPAGRPLGDMFMDDNFAGLTRTNGAIISRISDPASNYTIQIAGLSPEMKTLQLYTPSDRAFVVLEDQFNYNDPFNKEWGGRNTGMVVLNPGASVVWHVRLTLPQQ